MKKIELKKYRISDAKHCFIVRKGPLVEKICEKYGRRVALKIFDLDIIEKEEDFYSAKWGDDPSAGQPRVNTLLWEATQIQNIASWFGFAPRVYGLETVFLGDAYRPVQIIEFLDSGPYISESDAFEIYKKIEGVGEILGIKHGKIDVSADDAIDGKLVDFQTFYFDKPYEETVKELYFEMARYGKVYYQDVPELDMRGGPRKSELRIKELGLDRIAFDRKKVWDVGCAGGFFCRYADNMGAQRVAGFDMKWPVTAAKHMANYLGNFNIDFQQADLSDEKVFISSPRPDIVFFLSMNFHIAIPEFLKYCPFVILEDNGKESRLADKLGSPWTDWFSKIEFIGRASDHGNKPIYHLSHD